MLNIKFTTDEDIMARMMISNNKMPVDFANYLWYKYKPSYMHLQRDFRSNEIDENIILELKKQEFFKNYCDEAKKNLLRIEKIWKKNNDKINLFLNSVFKKEFVLNTTAIIVTPALCYGMNIGNNEFVWGHKKGLTDKNYDLVYLVHESLHSYFKNSEITHAIIENISDIELAKFLNNAKSGYTCHDNLKKMHVKIQPFWNIYLNKTKEEIEKEKVFDSIYYDQNHFSKYQTQIKNMNIDDFIEFIDKTNLDDLMEVKSAYMICSK